MNKYAVFGNPISYSKSPSIYFLFAKQKINKVELFSYKKILASLDNFEYELNKFLRNGGIGANITSPLKMYAYSLCDKLTYNSTITRTVNTIKKLKNGTLLGDNTDGIGLIHDLKRLKFLRQKSNILLIGAGGAARGVIYQLLIDGHKITLTNRSFIKAKELELFFFKFGNIIALPKNKIGKNSYNLIINATTTSVNGIIPSIPESIINPKVCCYDMFYQYKNTSFIKWCQQKGAIHCADGLGMLVYQAAFSFLLWHGTLPSVLPVIETIRKELLSNDL